MAKKRANTGVPTKWELTERKFERVDQREPGYSDRTSRVSA